MRGKKRTGFLPGIVVSVLMTVVALSGCSTTSGVEASGKTSWDDQGARTLEKNVHFNNLWLQRDIEIVDIKSVQAGDIMKVQAILRSKGQSTLPFQYRFDWYDAGGLEINSGAGSWKPLILNGRESKTVQSVAPDSRAKEFKLKIREPD